MPPRITERELHAAALTLASALALGVGTALTWYDFGPTEYTAWQAFSSVDLLIAISCVAGISAALGSLMGLRRLVSVTAPVAAVLATATVVALIIADPPGETSPAAGLYLGSIAATVLAMMSAILAAVSHYR